MAEPKGDPGEGNWSRFINCPSLGDFLSLEESKSEQESSVSITCDSEGRFFVRLNLEKF